ncbi:hypothetical protein GN958_ATG04453 [Phytophthora infestans]|uniref:Uncharacterized protein n=1 Tax=Phytophthora infestans TaxID=4787 RepID=A0A8S9V044_PHYIN|nr:hypothetical protein GN958_ATG04453 [Phytophthora infestans]
MDLTQSDVSERILQYFRLFRQLVEEEGLEGCFIGNEGAKERYKLLVASIEPATLRDNIKSIIKYQNRAAGENERELFDLVVKMALEQDRETAVERSITFRRAKSNKTTAASPPVLNIDVMDRTKSKCPGLRTNASSARDSKSGETKGPRDGCLKCGGAHYLSKCPDASEDEKNNLLLLHCGERKKDSGREVKRAKRIKDCIVEDDRCILINGKLRMPYCANSGSDNSMIGRSKAEDLPNWTTV